MARLSGYVLHLHRIRPPSPTVRKRGFFGTFYVMRLLAVLLLLTALGATASVGHRFMSLFETVVVIVASNPMWPPSANWASKSAMIDSN